MKVYLKPGYDGFMAGLCAHVLTVQSLREVPYAIDLSDQGFGAVIGARKRRNESRDLDRASLMVFHPLNRIASRALETVGCCPSLEHHALRSSAACLLSLFLPACLLRHSLDTISHTHPKGLRAGRGPATITRFVVYRRSQDIHSLPRPACSRSTTGLGP